MCLGPLLCFLENRLGDKTSNVNQEVSGAFKGVTESFKEIQESSRRPWSASRGLKGFLEAPQGLRGVPGGFRDTMVSQRVLRGSWESQGRFREVEMALIEGFKGTQGRFKKFQEYCRGLRGAPGGLLGASGSLRGFCRGS